MNDEELEEQIIAALQDKPLRSEELLCRLGIEPGGGELVPAIRNLMKQRIIKRHETFVYELNGKMCRLCGADVMGDTSLLNCNDVEIPVCDSCIRAVHRLCDRNPC